MNPSQITEWCQAVIRWQVPEHGIYVDATMGNGHDTLFLCRLAGEHGKVWAFDIQDAALRSTKKRLEDHGLLHRACLIRDGHEHMDRYLAPRTADAVCFNLGYLPGGDHDIATGPQTSVEAIRKGLEILKYGGLMSLCVYSGGDTGYEEKNVVLGYLKTLPKKEYTVIVNSYFNRENDPPMPVFVFKSPKPV